MGEITIAAHEREALRALDSDRLATLIDQAVNEERSGELHRLRLTDCGPYVASKLRSFENALADHGKAKAAKKRAETGDRLRRAGSDLEFAVSQMKQRLDREEADERLFQIDDQIMPPNRLSERMSVRVTYRWRKRIEDEWAHGSITVTHDVDERPDYALPAQKRKPSAAKREQNQQDKLYRTWEHLMQLMLYSVRDYLREGRDGSEIPQAFKAISDSYTRGLNNYSVDFWRKRP